MYRAEQRYFGNFGLGKLEIVRKIKLWIFPKINDSEVAFDGFTIELDPVFGFSRPDLYKPYVVALIKETLGPGDIAIDLGANIGFFTLFMSRAVGQAGKVFAFEPSRRNLNLFRRNLVRNGCQNVAVFECAAGDEHKRESISDFGVHSAVGTAANERERVTVAPVDNFVTCAHFIKMDIIGSEPKALRGMRKLIARSANLVMITAFCPAYIRDQGEDPIDFLNALHELHFSLRVVQKYRSHDIKDVAPENFPSLVEEYSRNGIDQTDIICIKK